MNQNNNLIMSFPIIKGLDRELTSEDILTFYKKSTKTTNDEFNKIRECIISNVCSFPEFPIDDDYIEQWSYIYILTHNLLEDIAGTSDFEITQKAGRKFNNDFELLANGRQYLLEFKSNNIPQVASIYTNNKMVKDLDYAGYFYENYLGGIVGDCVDMIGRDDYLRDINKTKPEQTEHPDFFKFLKENAGKHVAINESIKTFLEANYMKFDLRVLSDYFLQNLTKKIFILYDCSKLEYTVLDTIQPDDVKLLRIDSTILNGNTVIMYSCSYKFKFLLRWKNHKGCLGPAWQISMEPLT